MTLPVASISTLPALPIPEVSTDIVAPSLNSRELVVILIPIASPTPPLFTVLKTPPEFPEKLTLSLAKIVTIPASPIPEVLVEIREPPVKSRESAVTVISPASPTASSKTRLKIWEPISKTIPPLALISILPGFP